MKNALGVEIKRQEVFHGQQPKFALMNMVRNLASLNDGDTFIFQNDGDIEVEEDLNSKEDTHTFIANDILVHNSSNSSLSTMI
jgi:intein/homing endonuclease